ncbi:MAG: helix-turn-helix domain-containing protein [Victivallales bacterium]|nr:helix-turn-helix domain-containing protein [Victivallales bacterium]
MDIPENIIMAVTTLLAPYTKKEITPEAIKELCEGKKEQGKTISDNELLTYDQTCKLLHISKMTLHNWRKQGIIKIFKPVGSRHKAYVLRSSINIDS